MDPLILIGVGVGVALAIRKLRRPVEIVIRRSRHVSEIVKLEVLIRDERCLRCGSTRDLQFDHVIPWSQGGPNTAENLQLLCGSCNRWKGTRTMDFRPRTKETV